MPVEGVGCAGKLRAAAGVRVGVVLKLFLQGKLSSVTSMYFANQ